MPELTPELLLDIYANGLFPMAEDRNASGLFWVDPERRGILPLDAFHLPRRLARTVRADYFQIGIDQDFAAVVGACAAPAPGRRRSWINEDIARLYIGLHRLGHAHSIECRAEGELVGGLYGVRLGAAFFGESMFSRARDASKVALTHLVARLKVGGFRLLDAQFITPHLTQFGAIEVPRAHYRRLLRQALSADADFYCLPAGLSGAAVLQSITQTS